LLADVVDVVGVVELDIDGPDSPRFGAALASAAAAMMIVPARQLVAKTLRIMSTLRFRYAPSVYPYQLHERRRHRVQTIRTPGLGEHTDDVLPEPRASPTFSRGFATLRHARSLGDSAFDAVEVIARAP
jgi:hypothetical protein